MIRYEWDCEQVDRESEDVIDHEFGDTLEEVRGHALRAERCNPGFRYDIVLCRYDENDRYTDISWAYMREDGTLPDHFADAGGREVAKVPKRFHKEVGKVKA